MSNEQRTKQAALCGGTRCSLRPSKASRLTDSLWSIAAALPGTSFAQLLREADACSLPHIHITRTASHMSRACLRCCRRGPERDAELAGVYEDLLAKFPTAVRAAAVVPLAGELPASVPACCRTARCVLRATT